MDGDSLVKLGVIHGRIIAYQNCFHRIYRSDVVPSLA